MGVWRDPDRALRAAVMIRFAVTERGQPVRCAGPHGRFSKVVFETQAAARGAATELERLGNDPQYTFPCKVGGGKHWHLTRKPQKNEEE